VTLRQESRKTLKPRSVNKSMSGVKGGYDFRHLDSDGEGKKGKKGSTGQVNSPGHQVRNWEGGIGTAVFHESYRRTGVNVSLQKISYSKTGEIFHTPK